jgi:predicted alpha/beta-fold hydrolase
MIEDFRPRFPWYGPDLQTLRNFIARPRVALPQAETLTFPMGDGDVLVGDMNRAQGGAARPLVVLIHGLTGCSDSAYMRASAAAHLASGANVLRLNLRGAGPVRARGMYHAGRSEDFRRVVELLDAPNGLHAVGYSLGANMLLKYLSEGAGKVAKAASVSAPIDLSASSMRLLAPRNRVYHDYLLRRMREDALRGHSDLGPVPLDTVANVRTIWDFDDKVVAPRNGFAGAGDYYARCSALPRLKDISVPTALVHALDDPWIPGALYANYDWAANPNLEPFLSPGGGHVGFHGAGSRIAWHDRAIVGFFASP